MKSSRTRLAAVLGALALGVSAFGGLVLPKLGAGAPPDSSGAVEDTSILVVRTEVEDECEDRQISGEHGQPSYGV
jgi:hypothetical protein